jgi:hypothetical protein
VATLLEEARGREVVLGAFEAFQAGNAEALAKIFAPLANYDTLPDPPLFTNGSDGVNFNSLSSSQIDAINDYPLAIYNSLGGDDVVTLPNVANYQLTGSVRWDPTQAFVTGNGDDTIKGGDGSYKVFLGDGTDSVTITGAGNNFIDGGNGFDTISVGNGDNGINVHAMGGNVTVGTGVNNIASFANVPISNLTTNATTVGYTALAGINLFTGMTFKPAIVNEDYTDTNLGFGGLQFHWIGRTDLLVTKADGKTSLGQLINTQFVQSGSAGGAGSKMPLFALNITVNEGGADSGYGTISATDNGQAIPGLASNVRCAYDQLMPVPDGIYDVNYRTNALSKHNQPAFDFSAYNGASWFGPKRTNIELHIGNYPGDSDGCIVVGSTGIENGFWNNLNSFMTTIFNGAQATSNDEITKNGQKFYPLLIPVIITVENSPAQPNLVIESPVTNGLTSSVKFAITGLSTTAIIDKDITFYFTVSGAAASDYTVTGATNYGTLPDGSGLYSAAIEGSHNHEDDPTKPAAATISITYTGSTPTPLTVTLAPDGPLLENNAGNAYYVGKTYGNQYDLTGQPAPYAPPSQPLKGANGLSQTIDFTGPVLSATTKPASAGIDEVGGGSAMDLLGRFDSQFSMTIPETHNGAFARDTWLSPVSSAGTYSGAFAYHSDRSAGGARDVWGIGGGDPSPIGHGPGPG